MSTRSSPTYSVCSPCPADFHDAHSSEEELEVINSPAEVATPTATLSATPSSQPEKRKWSQIASDSTENEENVSR